MTSDKPQDPFAKYGVRDLYGHKKKVLGVAWNCSGRKLASGGVDTLVCTWSLEPDGRLRREGGHPDQTLAAHGNVVEALAWDPILEHRLATTSSDKTLRIWDARQGKDICRISSPGVNIYLAWHPDGNHLAVGSRENTVVVLDLRRPSKPLRVTKNDSFVNEIAFSACGKYFLQTCAAQNALEIFRFPSFERTRVLLAHTGEPYALALDPTGRYIATGGNDAVTCVWDARSLACAQTFTMRDTPVRSLSFSADGRYLAVASEHVEPREGGVGGQPCTVDIQDVDKGRVVHTIEAQRARQLIDCIRWNPKHPLLAYPGPYDDRRDGPYGSVSVFAPGAGGKA